MEFKDLESILNYIKVIRRDFQKTSQECRKSSNISESVKSIIEDITSEAKLLASECNSLRYATNGDAKPVTLKLLKGKDWLRNEGNSESTPVTNNTVNDVTTDTSISESQSYDKSTESADSQADESTTSAITMPYKRAKKSSQVNRKYMMKQYCQQLDNLSNIKFPAFSNDSWLGSAINYIHRWYKIRFTSKFKNYKVDNIPLWVLKILCSFAYDEVIDSDISRSVTEFENWFNVLESKGSAFQDCYSLPANCHSKFLSVNQVPENVVTKLIETKNKLKNLGFTLLEDVDCVNQWFNPQSVAI